MKIKVTGAWFTPGNTLLKTGTYEVPDSWEDQLPSNAEEVEEEEAPKAKAAPAAKPKA